MAGVGDICQSCGMPLTKEEFLGTDIIGEKVYDYCIYCYSDGGFVDKRASLRKMIDKSINLQLKQGISKEVAKEVAEKTIPKLKRWRRK